MHSRAEAALPALGLSIRGAPPEHDPSYHKPPTVSCRPSFPLLHIADTQIIVQPPVGNTKQFAPSLWTRILSL